LLPHIIYNVNLIESLKSIEAQGKTPTGNLASTTRSTPLKAQRSHQALTNTQAGKLQASKNLTPIPVSFGILPLTSIPRLINSASRVFFIPAFPVDAE
jgi:hypothetical protein